MPNTTLSDEELEKMYERVQALRAEREAEEEKKKARWAKYYEQLAKATPFQGGAKKARREGHVLRWDN